MCIRSSARGWRDAVEIVLLEISNLMKPHPSVFQAYTDKLRPAIGLFEPTIYIYIYIYIPSTSQHGVYPSIRSTQLSIRRINRPSSIRHAPHRLRCDLAGWVRRDFAAADRASSGSSAFLSPMANVVRAVPPGVRQPQLLGNAISHRTADPKADPASLVWSNII